MFISPIKVSTLTQNRFKKRSTIKKEDNFNFVVCDLILLNLCVLCFLVVKSLSMLCWLCVLVYRGIKNGSMK